MSYIIWIDLVWSSVDNFYFNIIKCKGSYTHKSKNNHSILKKKKKYLSFRRGQKVEYSRIFY